MNRMSGDDFTLQYENSQLATGRNKTWLCQIRSVNGGEAALQVFENEGSEHAEEICLQANEAAIKKADRYEITWYLSWSPCGARAEPLQSPCGAPAESVRRSCASQIIKFVEEHPNGKLNIFVSRLYYCKEPYNLASKTPEEQTKIKQKIKLCREGLGNLKQHERIGLKVMTLTDFQDCFDRFVGEGNGFQNWADPAGNSEIYAAILEEITGAGL